MKKIVFLLLIAYSQYLLAQDINNFKVSQVLHYGERVLQLSADKNNELGVVQIMDSKQNIVYEVKDIELIKAPFYTTISINELPAGNYMIHIKTASNISAIPFSVIK